MKKSQKLKISFSQKKNMVAAVVLAAVSVVLVLISSMVYNPSMSFLKANVLNFLWLSIFVFAALMVFYFYIFYQNKKVYDSNKNLVLVLVIIFITLLLTLCTMRYVDIYAVPIAMCGVLIAILVNQTLGYIANAFVTVILSVLYLCMQFLVEKTLDINILFAIIIALLQGYGMMFMIKKNYTRFKLLWGALAMGLVFAPIATVTSLSTQGFSIDILWSTLYCLAGNAIGVAMFTAMLPIYESTFNVWTNFKLAEACSVSRPLLQRLANEAGGSFNHSIIVSNICESCALEIGENPYLAKASAMYHDVGKLQNPEYFIENQTDGYNPHDDLIPEQSVKIITAHASNGYKLLKESHLPESVAKIALEHHGTSAVSYFYNKAQNISETTLDNAAFRYGGPKPTSKIAAIVMIADIVEASTRAKVPNNLDELTIRIDSIISSKIKEGQFSDCDITFKDLEKIKQTIIRVIPSIFHKRIDYNNNVKQTTKQ